MKLTPRPRRALVAGATISLAFAAAVAPGAVAAETIDGDVAVTNTETVAVRMDAGGNITNARIYEQLVLTGRGSVDIGNPVPDGLRNLDGFRGWEVNDGVQRVRTDVSGTQKYRSVADFDGDLPVEIDVTYRLNGTKVEPKDLVGKSGELEVVYSVRNTTAVQQEVTFLDGNGDEHTRLQAIVIPLVGSLTTTLPSNFTKVRSNEANAAGDGRGGTTLSFTMTLFEPIGSDRATFGYTARITDGVVPEANVSLLPVNPLESPSFSGGAESLQGGAETGADLTAGATTIDENLLRIRDGAADLVAGILQLEEGAGQLSAGLNDTAVPGARQLAAGAGELDAGAGELASGARELAGGARDLNEGAATLNEGLRQASAGAPGLVDGLAGLDAGLVRLQGEVRAGSDEFQAQFGVAVDASTQDLANNLGAIVTAFLTPAFEAIQANPDLTPEDKGALLTQIGSARVGLGQIQDAATTTTRAQLKGGVAQGLDAINAGIAGGIGQPSDGERESLRGGVSALRVGGQGLVDGLGRLSAGAGQLADGTGRLVDGSGRIADGSGRLADGTDRLSAGAGQLSNGLGDAASGSARLADGLSQAAESAPALPEGAETLSEQGTSQLVNVGNATAMDYGLQFAVIEAGAERAASAQPFGSPEGAQALAAYRFTLASETGEGSANATRAIAAALLAAAGVGIAAVRRRQLFG